MDKETGEIRAMWGITNANDPGEHVERYQEFTLGEIVDIKGIPMELIKVKKLRGELVFRHRYYKG